MIKAVIYARYTSSSQTEQSIEGQVRVCREFAEITAKKKNNPNTYVRIVITWRRVRDLNPRALLHAYTLSRGAPSASWVTLRIKKIYWCFFYFI